MVMLLVERMPVCARPAGIQAPAALNLDVSAKATSVARGAGRGTGQNAAVVDRHVAVAGDGVAVARTAGVNTTQDQDRVVVDRRRAIVLVATGQIGDRRQLQRVRSNAATRAIEHQIDIGVGGDAGIFVRNVVVEGVGRGFVSPMSPR